MKTKLYATFTTFEPPYKHKDWGSECIEVAAQGDIPCPSSVVSEQGLKEITGGRVVTFFPDDIDYYRVLRPLFGER